MTKRQAEVSARFKNDVANHVMTILRDDGLYRHLKFRGKCMTYWFDIVTWPGVLTIHGDCGTFVFTRIEDMVEFFREPEINYYYWTQKCVSVDRSGGIEEFSHEAFVEAVVDDMKSWTRWNDDEPVSDDKIAEWRDMAEGWIDDGHHEAVGQACRFEMNGEYPLQDFWEHDCKERTYEYLWCLNAIFWGVRMYVAAKAGEAK